MFTGIVQERLTITNIVANDVLTVSLANPTWGVLEIGESILLHGICSTVVARQANTFTVEFMAETRQRTNVKNWQLGQTIHAEPAATLQTKLSGNLVYGHVDATGEITNNESGRMQVKFPTQFQLYVLEKGSVTINGINLTITQVQPDQFTVQLIPHTAAVTTLAQQAVGSQVNLEFDYLTKVIVQTTQQHLTLIR